MIHLHTLGDAMIKVGEKEIRPSSPMVFAALLYLAVERGRRVPRTALQELLFPNSDERSGAHSLRQLLYKLRQFGAPIEVDATGVRIGTDGVVEDNSQTELLETLLRRESDDSFAVLPSYGAAPSEAYDQWLGNYRDRAGRRLRGFLEQRIARERKQASWAGVERYSQLLVRIDPLSECGILALAEALAMSGLIPRALKLLDEYCAELGDSNVTIKVRRLRARLRQQSVGGGSGTSPVPLCGRVPDLAALLDFLHRQHACGDAVLVSGAAGIGKTRLVQEFGTIAALEGFHVEWCACSEGDSSRPSALLARLVSRLLRLPGALGTTPHSLALLTRLTAAPSETGQSWANAAENEALRNALDGAIKDLVESVAGESPLCLVVEDAQWIDRSSRESLLGVINADFEQRVLLLFTSRERSLSPARDQHTRVLSYPLEPLSDEAATELLARTLGDDAEPDFLRWAVKIAAGNPFFLKAIASNYQQTGKSFELPPTLRVLMRQSVECLDQGSRQLLEAAAVLGRNSSIARIARVTASDARSMLPTMRELEARGLMRRHDEWVGIAHDLLREEVLVLLPPASRTILHGLVAEVVFQEARQSQNAALLWDCADHWSLAGDVSRSVEVVLSCADQLVNIGEVDAAYDLVVRAKSLRPELPMTYKLAQKAANIAFSRDDMQTARAHIEQMRHLSSSLRPRDVDFDELELLECEIQRLGGNSIADRLPSLLRILDSASTGGRHRLQAARVLLIHSDLNFDNCLADRVIGVVRSLAAPSVVEKMLQLGCHLIYDVVFGDITRVYKTVEAVDTVIAELPVALTIRHRVNSAVALFRAGHLKEAFQRLRDIYVLGVSLHNKGTAFVAASKVVLLNGLLGLEADDEWKQIVRETGDALLRDIMLLELHCLDLVKSGSISDAVETLQQYKRFASPGEMGRCRTTSETIEIWLAIRQGDRAEIRKHCNELLKVHDRAAVCGLYDYEMETLYVGLWRIGEHTRAQTLLREYVSSQRRDGFPPNAGLRRLIDELKLSDPLQMLGERLLSV